MIKEKLMKALKVAAEGYNGGMNASAAVAKAAESADFNEKQAERLVEMFNTAVALNKEKDASDPTGACELADKSAVSKILMDGSSIDKSASYSNIDYSFYGMVPDKTNPSIEARMSGRCSMCKAASSGDNGIPDELNVSQRSLYKIIEGKIDLLKSAAAAADDVVRNLRLDIEDKAVKIAKAIESPYADVDLADMFKAACEHKHIVDLVSEYSTKVAESTGGMFSSMSVFDASKAEELLKVASEASDSLSAVKEYETKRDMYMSKAAEAHKEMLEAVGLTHTEVSASTLADMFQGVAKKASSEGEPDKSMSDAEESLKIAEILRESGISAEEVSAIAEDFEKDAATGVSRLNMSVPIPTLDEAYSALSKVQGVDNERRRIMNIRRSILLADLMANDPIIRDADPNTVVEAYKTMIMTSPRVSLDKAQARAFLRSAVNSVAISPSDAKVIADVDKGVSLSNLDRIGGLTALDSSIKDSNV